ncbi:MAG: hypothetical protein K8S97_00480 [Anaerolineae bacterium]|nr:hypothetical protein [Anaerolineae bacterium]
MVDLQITITFEELLALLDRLTPVQRAQARARLSSATTEADDYYSLAQVNHRIYERARHYWHAAGLAAQSQLSDADLDEQFWGFDRDGIPRLKSEITDTTPPPGSLAALAAATKQHEFVSGDPTISARSREILESEFADYLRKRTTTEDNDASQRVS